MSQVETPALERVQKFLEIEQKSVKTWFDMGLYLDNLSDQYLSDEKRPNIFDSKYKSIAFLAFDFGVDGVSIEISKYGQTLEQILNEGKSKINVHCLGGSFNVGAEEVLLPHWHKKNIKELAGFDTWRLYDDMFNKKMQRGSPLYNSLASDLWSETVNLVDKLSKYIFENKIDLLIPVNVCSNPGNVAFAFATVIVSELMQVAVLNSSHDFYWEVGQDPSTRKDGETGYRDHFFTNCHLGEVFSLIETIYPWNSPLWFQTVINEPQIEHLTNKKGINPNRILCMPTAVDINKYQPRPEIDRYQSLRKLESLFTDHPNKLLSTSLDSYMQDPNFGSNRKPVLLAKQDKQEHRFDFANLLLLQPTRILERKRVEENFNFISSLLCEKHFFPFFNSHPELKITLLVTGPVAVGQQDYFQYVVKKFKGMIESIPANFQERILLAFSFAHSHSPYLKEQEFSELSIEELFSSCHLVLLPSSQEGRGLPIIEACSSGIVPYCNRYSPGEVYAHVVGEHLGLENQLKVIDYKQDSCAKETLSKVARTLIDPAYCMNTIAHNRNVIKRRYSFEALKLQFQRSLQQLKHNFEYNSFAKKIVSDAFSEYNSAINKDNSSDLIVAKRRAYIPGVSKSEYMLYLKSLIDPSFFRVEEREIRGRLYKFASEMNKKVFSKDDLNLSHELYDSVESIFLELEGEYKYVADHSLSYRHRSVIKQKYRSFTEHELYGIIEIIYSKIFGISECKFKPHKGVFKSFSSLLNNIVKNKTIAIDDSARLITSLKSNVPLAWFPGSDVVMEASLFSQSIKHRLGISSEDEIEANMLRESKLAPIYMFVKKGADLHSVNEPNIINWLKNEATQNLRVMAECDLLKIIPTDVLSSGTNLQQLGHQAEKTLKSIINSDGYGVCFGDNHMLTMDLFALNTFRIGHCEHPFTSHILGIKENEAFIQWTPAGLKPCLAFPVPIQKGKDLYEALNGKDYKALVSTHGEDKVLDFLKKDADQFGSPCQESINKFKNSTTTQKDFSHTHVNGLHDDGESWSGVKVQIYAKQIEKLDFTTFFASEKKQTVIDLISSFESQESKQVLVAWNGGYILNPELVGKLGLPESYIGTPLGLCIKDGKILSPPLYNKPAILFRKNGSISIENVNLHNGITLSVKNHKTYIFPAENINTLDFNKEKSSITLLDLNHKHRSINCEGSYIYRLAGEKIISAYLSKKTSEELLPIGLTIISTSPLDGWEQGVEINYHIQAYEDVKNAVEAGPILVQDGKVSIEMESEGWKSPHSIATQAARVDFTHLRGPKLGVGLTDSGDLIIVAVNGRIRESVGATHHDLASILIENGATKAMGFDPGGSVTLVFDKKQLNITPYHEDFQKNPISHSAQARFVGNAVLGYLKNKK